MSIAAAQESPGTLPARRYGAATRWRSLKAYFVTLLVVSSYVWLQFRGRRSSRYAEKLDRAHQRNARRIYRAIIELQGLYIKVGQGFSIMTNFLPPAFRKELAALQDRVPPHPFSAIEERIRDEFEGRGPDELFREFDPTPIASASIGQVHRARLADGQLVAVKVQYPRIEQAVRADLRTLKRIIRIVARIFSYQGIDALFAEIRAMVLRELDFTEEARSVETIAANFADRDDVCFPKVFNALTTRRVLTIEYIDGVKVNDVEELARRGINRSDVAKLVIESCCQQIFHHGIYHADPHPGNILVCEGPKIYYLDFGAVANVSEKMRHGIVTLLHGALKRDTPKIVAGLRDMGFLAREADARIYDQVIEYFHTKFQQEVKLDSFNLRDIRFDPQKSFENIADLRSMNIALADITKSFHVPKEWILLERTVLLVIGLCTELDPDLNPTEVVRPYVEEFVFGEEGDWSHLMIDATREMVVSGLALPAELKKFISRALSGDLQIRLKGHRTDTQLRYAAMHQLIYTAFTISGAIAAFVCNDRGHATLATGSAIVAGGAALLLLRSMWRGQALLRDYDRRS